MRSKPQRHQDTKARSRVLVSLWFLTDAAAAREPDQGTQWGLLRLPNHLTQRVQLLLSAVKEILRKTSIGQHVHVDGRAFVEVEPKARQVLHSQITIEIDRGILQPLG